MHRYTTYSVSFVVTQRGYQVDVHDQAGALVCEYTYRVGGQRTQADVAACYRQATRCEHIVRETIKRRPELIALHAKRGAFPDPIVISAA